MKFSEEDREACVSVIRHILQLAKDARRNGILSLESEAENEENIFLKTGLEMVVDGVDPCTIKETLANLLAYSEYTPKEYLERVIISQAVTAIQMGENPITMAVRLYAILGEGYLHNADIPLEDTWRPYNELLQKHQNRTPLTLSRSFEEKVAKLSYRDIQLIERNIDTGVMASALLGCSIGTIINILHNVSKKRCLQISELMLAYNDPESTIAEAQGIILNSIKRLEDTGEIIGFANPTEIPSNMGVSIRYDKGEI